MLKKEPSNKRVFEHTDDQKKVVVGAFDLSHLPENLPSEAVKQLIDEADRDTAQPTIDVSNMKQVVSQLQTRIQRNEEMRLRYPENPEKFLKSEVDLEEDITRIKNTLVTENLLKAFIQENGFFLLISLLNHSNVDLASAVAATLVDLTSPDTDFDDAVFLVDELMKQGIPCFIGELLCRLNEAKDDEDQQIITTVLQVVDNMLEIHPTVVSDGFVTESPKFISWIIRRLRITTDPKDTTGVFFYNRCYCSEILSVILQYSETSRTIIGSHLEYNGVEKLLRCLAHYRKVDPQSAEEDEFVSNIVNCLTSLLEETRNQDVFGTNQGIDLMIRLLRDRRKVYSLALKVTISALREHQYNCRIFIERLGLKSLFGIFLKRGVHCRPGSQASRNEDEYCLNIILHLCRYTSGTPLARLLNKFMENKCEKVERLLELHQHYYDQVAQSKAKRRLKEVEELKKQLAVDEDEMDYLEQCDAGLFILQCADNILVRLANMGNTLVTQQLHSMLNIKGVKLEEIESVIRGYIGHLSPSSPERPEIEAFLDSFLTPQSTYDGSLLS